MGYRILSMDGGGSWALIEVRALIELYSPTTTGHEVLADFDLVAGNSGGSQVLAGLLEDLTLKDLLAYYQDEAMRRSLFSPTPNWLYRWLNRHIDIGPAYSTHRKLEVLQEHLPKTGSKTLAEAAKGLGRGAADIHRLDHRFRLRRQSLGLLPLGVDLGSGLGPWPCGRCDACRGNPCLDQCTGELFRRPGNPAQRRALLGWRYHGLQQSDRSPPSPRRSAEGKRRPISSCSAWVPARCRCRPAVRRTRPNSPFVRPPGKTGLLNDIHRLATSIMDDPPDVATFLAHVMTGGDTNIAGSPASRVVRMNPKISPVGAPGAWGPPGKMTDQQFKDISTLAVDALEQKDVDKIAAYTELWLKGEVPNQPIREDTTTMKLELGSATFKEAASLWQGLKSFY